MPSEGRTHRCHRPPQATMNNWISRINARQFHPEFAPFADFRFEAYPSLHSLDGFAHDRQSDSGSLILIISMQSLKHAKQPLLRLVLNTDTVVLEAKPYSVLVSLAVHSHARFHPARYKLHRVIQKVRNTLCQRSGMTNHSKQRTLD